MKIRSDRKNGSTPVRSAGFMLLTLYDPDDKKMRCAFEAEVADRISCGWEIVYAYPTDEGNRTFHHVALVFRVDDL